jgi:hypothetical protein
MPRLLGMVIRWSLLPLLFLLAQAMACELFRAARAQGLGAGSILHPFTLWFIAGLAFRGGFSWLLRRLGRHDPFEFIDTLEHELTHALMGYATFCPPVSLTASLKSGGEVELKGTNPLAALAPYCLPLWCLATATLGMAVKPDMQTGWNHLLFFLLGAFAYRVAREYRWRQTDLHLYGFVFSTLCVFILLLASLALLFHLRGLLSARWLTAAAIHAWRSLPLAWSWLSAYLGGSPGATGGSAGAR